MKRSIKRKIQNSMFLANVLTLLIVTLVIYAGIQMSFMPISFYITESVAGDFMKKYDYTGSGSVIKKDNFSGYMEDLSVNQVIANLNNLIKKEQKLPSEMIADMEKEIDLKIVALNESDYKHIFVISKDVYESSNRFEIQFKLIQMDVLIDEWALYIPAERNPESSSVANMAHTSSKVIQIINEEGTQIGAVTIRMNPDLILVIYVMTFIMWILLSVFSILIVKLVSKVMTKGIMRPINQINTQLKLMATNEIDQVNEFKLQLKKPPIEVAEMIDHSNAIIGNFKKFSDLLENQNEELQMQNDELNHSRFVIENQQNQLIQSEKMASVGQISAAVVHEINTPIGAIKSNAQILDLLIAQLSTEQDQEKIRKKVGMMKPTNDMIVDASDRVIQIVKSIKNFSRIDQSAFKEADLHEAIDSVLLLTSNMWKSRITIVKAYGSLPPVNCYIGLINQVIMNLVVNAIDAIETAGEILITTGIRETSAYIAIKDTGSGIDPDNMEKIFEQGFTTKAIGKGSGLGLAISLNIMEKHAGQILVESVPGSGSTFTILIPIKAPDKNL